MMSSADWRWFLDHWTIALLGVFRGWLALKPTILGALILVLLPQNWEPGVSLADVMRRTIGLLLMEKSDRKQPVNKVLQS